MKLKIHHYWGSLGSVVVYSSLASQSQSLSKLPYFPRIYYIHRHNYEYDSTLYLEDHWETGLYVWGTKQMKIFIILQLVSYRITLILFTVFAGKTCSAVSPLPEDFYANFDGDPLLMTHRMTTSCGQCFSVWIDRTASFTPHWPFMRSVHDHTNRRSPVWDES